MIDVYKATCHTLVTRQNILEGLLYFANEQRLVAVGNKREWGKVIKIRALLVEQ